MTESDRKKKEGVYCCAYGCDKKPQPKKGMLCHKHYRDKVNARDPVAIRYNEFKHNAKKRGKENTVTLEQFRAFCDETGYIIEKGKRGKKATLDRTKNYLGYSIYNIQLLTNRQNIHKYWNEDRFEERPEGFEIPEGYEPPNMDEDLPF